MAKRGFIYVIGAKDSGRVKVGYSTDPWRRLRQIQTVNPDDLSVLYYFPGTKGTEALLHAMFRPSRLRGEWFSNAAVICWVAEHIQATQVAKALSQVGLAKWPADDGDLRRLYEAYDRHAVTAPQIDAATRKVFPSEDGNAAPAPANLLDQLFGAAA